MNYQRQEMERRLPPPSPLLCSHLWNKTSEAGLRLSKEDIALLAKIFGDYVQNTKEGKLTVLKLLNATTRPAEVRDLFYPAGQRVPGRELKPQDLVAYSGWIYKEKVGVSLDQIERVTGGNLEACDSTGILGPKGYCVQTVKVYGQGGRETLTSLSNYARMHSEDLNVRSTANMNVCYECKTEACEYHPSRSQLRLLPLRSTSNG